MKRRSARNGILTLTVVANALAAAYSPAWAAGEAAYTPSPVSMDPDDWTRDRAGDPGLGFVTDWQGREALKLSITKPPGSNSFNNWQGYSQKVDIPAATGEAFLRGDIWIGSDWAAGGTETDFKNTGMWGSAMPEDTVAGGSYVDAKAVFPIIHFTNQVDAEANPGGVGMLRIWDTSASDNGWVYLPETAGLIDYGGWNTIDLRLVSSGAGTAIEYYFNGTKIYTWNDPQADDGSSPEQYYAMYLKARNGDDVTNYDTYWSRLLGGAVYSNGRIDDDVAGDVMVDSGGSVTVAPGVTIDGNLVLDPDSAAGGGSSAGRATVTRNIQVDDGAILSGYWRLPTGSVVATGDAVIRSADIEGSTTQGGTPNLVHVAEGAKVQIVDSRIRNDLDHPTGRNGRTVLVTGTGSTVTIRNSDLELRAYSTNAGTDYGHAFTAVVGASEGGHAEIVGGSIKARGSKRTVGLHAIDGGSIRASGGLTIDTYDHFGHAVNAYSNPADASPADTLVELDGVKITTHSDEYSVGIQSANKGARVVAKDTAISTVGAGSFGVEVFNGAALSYTGGSIATTGQGAAGVRTYGGSRGSGVSTVNGTTIATRGQGAAGVLAGDAAEPTAGTVALAGATIRTTGAGSSGIESGYGSSVTATDSSVATSGTNAHGIRAHRGGRVTVSGGSVAAEGAGSSGVYVEDAASVTLNGVAVSARDASITSQLNQAGQTQTITVGSGSRLTVNNGTLLKVNRSTAGMDGIVNLTLKAGATASGDVVDLDGLVKGGSGVRAQGGKTNFVLEAGSQWTGIVQGVNDTEVGDGASFQNDGSAPVEGNVSGGQNSTIVFTNDATITGGVQTGSGSTATFSGATDIGGSVIGTGSSFVFDGPATIGQGVSGVGSSFQFSQTGPTEIQGGLALSQGSSVKGGTQQTPIVVQGDTTAESGSTVGGNLDIRGQFSAIDSILSAGNSVGTITADTLGSLSGTRMDVEVNAAGQADLLVVRKGDVDLAGASLRVDQENGTGGYRLDHDYTIVQARDGKVVNTFDAAALGDSFAGTLVQLDPVQYGASDVRISLSVDQDAAADRTGLSGNQSATLDGLLSVTGRNAVADAVSQLPAGERAQALDQLSGEVHASTQAALLQAGGLVSRTVSQRLRANLGAERLPGDPLASGAAAPADGAPRSSAHPLWAQVVGSWDKLDGNGNAAKARSEYGGLFVGGDAGLSGGWRVGGALGYTDGRVEVDDRSSRSGIDSYTAAIYGGNSWARGPGRLNLTAGAAYTRHDIDSRRSVDVGGSQTLKAGYHADTAQVFAELGYAIPVKSRFQVEPYAGLGWLSQKTDDFTEWGGEAALSGDEQTDDVTLFTLGLRGTVRIDTDRLKGRVSAGLGWRHASGDVKGERQMAFVQGGGAPFTISGAPLARNAALVDLGSEIDVGRNTAVGLGYNGQFGDGNTGHTGSLYMRVRF